ncbi:unnamed protein product [Adineta steineri]|uniref:Uncharacterized protein n=1 Tax=Adineta steineri TaxID=433720 RepID=A0A815R0B9_9BILA|nr:unnamed protein product [Adineta steineri]CAF1470728.1 unnamed protein product [Adineta steineri]
MRVYTPLGKKQHGTFALDLASKVLPFCAEYFNIKYPIAIPDFAFGYGQLRSLLIDPKSSSLTVRQRNAMTISHELAHQWFGNLVTMDWWTDLWLNEGFARWIQYLAVDRFYPERDVFSQFLVLDALKSSHPIEVPIGHPAEIDGIFDTISYAKGSSVIRITGKSGDQAIIDEAKNRFHQYMNGNLIDPNIRPAVYVVVSPYGDENSALSRIGRDISGLCNFVDEKITSEIQSFFDSANTSTVTLTEVLRFYKTTKGSKLRIMRQIHKNFNIVCLFDAYINFEENIDIQQIFKELDQCEQYIQSISSSNQLIFIVSNNFGQELIPRIHQLSQVYSIYIYCHHEQEFNQHWTEQYNKVKGIYYEIDQLIASIKSNEVGIRAITAVDEPLSMSICNVSNDYEQTTSDLDGRFVHSQLLIDCLLRMEPLSTDKNEFISFCLNEYHDNEDMLKIIKEFEDDYSTDRVIWWYTRETFIYRLLNKSLRIQNIDLLFTLRFLIRDIEQQLQQHQCSSPITVYRGQLISIEELELLKQSKGKLISMNSFLSTSLNRNTALVYLNTNMNDNTRLQRILFEIDADPCRNDIKPFANISSFSYFPTEDEILMMLGSVFRVNNLYLDEDQIWIMNITLCSDNDHDLKLIVDCMKNQYGSEQTRLLLFGHVLVDMAYFDDAEKYYHRLLKDLSSDDKDICNCYHALGKVTCEKGNYDASLIWLYKSLEIMKQKLKKNHSQIGFIYTSIGEVYQKQGNIKQALDSYEKALNIWMKTYNNDKHEYVAWCFNNIANIYVMEKKYSEALEYHKKALEIKEKLLPSSHPCLGNTYLNIGNVYYHIGQYDTALKNYELSKKTYEISLTPQHPSIASVLKNIGIIYEVKCDFSEAMKCYKQAYSIRQTCFSLSHPDITDIIHDIERISNK